MKKRVFDKEKLKSLTRVLALRKYDKHYIVDEYSISRYVSNEREHILFYNYEHNPIAISESLEEALLRTSVTHPSDVVLCADCMNDNGTMCKLCNMNWMDAMYNNITLYEVIEL